MGPRFWIHLSAHLLYLSYLTVLRQTYGPLGGILGAMDRFSLWIISLTSSDERRKLYLYVDYPHGFHAWVELMIQPYTIRILVREGFGRCLAPEISPPLDLFLHALCLQVFPHSGRVPGCYHRWVGPPVRWMGLHTAWCPLPIAHPHPYLCPATWTPGCRLHSMDSVMGGAHIHSTSHLTSWRRFWDACPLMEVSLPCYIAHLERVRFPWGVLPHHHYPSHHA